MLADLNRKKSSADTHSHAKKEINQEQEKELAVFGIRCMGIRATVKDIKNRSTRDELEQMVSPDLNLNGLLCADIVEVRPLKLNGKYEVECIGYGGGKGKKLYIIDALNGKVFVQ